MKIKKLAPAVAISTAVPLVPVLAHAASYGNADGTADMTVKTWGNNFATLKGTQKSYDGKKVYTQGRTHDAGGASSWKRVSTNTTKRFRG